MEIALKIAQKIREGADFRAYILVPLWPEGHPPSAAVQAVLFWQVSGVPQLGSSH